MLPTDYWRVFYISIEPTIKRDLKWFAVNHKYWNKVLKIQSSKNSGKMKTNLIQRMYIIMNRSEFSSNQGRERNNEKNSFLTVTRYGGYLKLPLRPSKQLSVLVSTSNKLGIKNFQKIKIKYFVGSCEFEYGFLESAYHGGCRLALSLTSHSLWLRESILKFIGLAFFIHSEKIILNSFNGTYKNVIFYFVTYPSLFSQKVLFIVNYAIPFHYYYFIIIYFYLFHQHIFSEQ